MQNGERSGDKIIIGKVTTTHGHRGELKILPLTEFPERFKEMSSVEVETNGRCQILHIDTVRKHKKFLIIKFQEIHDMDEAVLYRDADVVVSKSEVKALSEGSYYHFQLIGLDVYDEDGNYLGQIDKILEPGGHDIFAVIDRNSGKELLIPVVKEWVSQIDLIEKRVTVKLLPGLT
ncbi:ribosome maturation factor RimM [Metallumcola ferriviriculae]|uniref:Ribosome maturation factor RimM n=1 Tax=Metallumcola ferriviriculae TaxID=3039180 RepID=A0AAU0UPR1_9FIRM|nr:ribosome maturation factor RimM [Desulfitibacteraceae bacterium MK1]